MRARKKRKEQKGVSFEKVAECLYRNPSSGTYFALVKVRGKQIKASLEVKNLPEARRKLVDFKRDIGRVNMGERKITVERLADNYLETISGAPATIRKKTDITKRIKKQWGPRQVKDLSRIQIESWLSGLHGKRPASYNKYLRVLRAMMELALDSNYIAHSPTDRIKEKPMPKPMRHTPTLSEFEAIVKAIREQPLSDTGKESADFVEFMGLAGLGLAETASLRWGDVDFKREQIVTYRHKTKTGFPIPIYPQLRPLLEKRLRLATAANGNRGPSPTEKVFTVANPKKALEKACDDLELRHYTSRAFRRLFITTAIERGIDVKVIAQWQAHKDGGKLILGTYSHVNDAHAKRMATLMTTEKPANVLPMQGAA